MTERTQSANTAHLLQKFLDLYNESQAAQRAYQVAVIAEADVESLLAAIDRTLVVLEAHPSVSPSWQRGLVGVREEIRRAQQRK